MNDAFTNYLAAAFPDTVTVLGVRLQPFTLGHSLLLHRLGNPLVRGEQAALGDLIMFTEICRHPFPVARRRMESGVYPMRLVWLRWKWHGLTGLQEAQIRATLTQYLLNANRAPRIWREAGREGRVPGAPLLQSMKLCLMRLGRSETEVLSLPLALATWDYYTYWEMEGAIKIWTATDYALMEAHHRLEREVAEGMLEASTFGRGRRPKSKLKVPAH